MGGIGLMHRNSLLGRHANGHSYQGYADLRLDDWAHAYYGDAYSRLQRIKGHYDPRNLFHHAQSIQLVT